MKKAIPFLLVASVFAGSIALISHASASSNIASLRLSSALQQYLTAKDSVSLSPTKSITIEAWIKLASLPENGNAYTIVAKMDPVTLGMSSYRMHFANDATAGPEMVLQPFDGISYHTMEFPWNPNVNTWYHVAATCDQSGIASFYVNGALLNSISGCGTQIADSPIDLWVGGAPTTGYFFDGKIDDLRIYNTARTATEISSDYSRELIGTEPNLKGYWTFNNTLIDQAKNNNLTFHSYSSDVPF